jgi:GxxExxY protein
LAAEGAEGAEMMGFRQEPDGGLNRLAEVVIGAAIEVHRELGPGFLESLYEQALSDELAARSIPHARQVIVPVLYKRRPIGNARMDIVVDDRLLVELKATEGHSPLHFAQVLSYLQTTGLPLGLLINFNAQTLRQGLKRIVRSPPKISAPSAPSAAHPSPSPSEAAGGDDGTGGTDAFAGGS